MRSDVARLEVDGYEGLTSTAGRGRLTLEPRELVVVRGESGAGKTRFLRRLIDLEPTPQGNVRLAGVAIEEIPCATLRRRIGYLPQEPARFSETGRELFDQVRALRGNRDRCVSWQRVHAWLEQLGVADLLERSTRTYSGGELRRVALVNLLQLAPEVLLLDEPTTGLDPERADEVVRVVDTQRAEGRAVLWVSHDGKRYADEPTARISRRR